MARYYQTADREYLDDGIYMPPVELMSKVIAAKDAEIDQNLNNLNVIKDNVDTNIKYWNEANGPQAKEVQQYFDDKINNATQAIMEHPLNYDRNLMQGLQRELSSAMKQGGIIWNLAANEMAHQKALQDIAGIKDKEFAQRQYEYAKNMYLQEMQGKPLTESDIFDPSKYLTWTESMDPAAYTMNLIKEKKPYVHGSTSFDNLRGIKSDTTTTKLTKAQIAELMNDIADSKANPELLNYFRTADLIGWNGEDKWLDENGNINKEGRLWQNLVKQNQDFFERDDYDNKKSIFNDNLYNGFYNIGPKKDEEKGYAMPAAFDPFFDTHRAAFKNTAQAYLLNKYGNYHTALALKSPEPIKDKDGNIKKDKNGNSMYKNHIQIGFNDKGQLYYYDVNTGERRTENNMTDKDWVTIGSMLSKIRNDENSSLAYKDEDGNTKYFSDMFSERVNNYKASENDLDKVETQVFLDGGGFKVGHHNTNSYNQNRPYITIQQLYNLKNLDNLKELTGYNEYRSDIGDKTIEKIEGTKKCFSRQAFGKTGSYTYYLKLTLKGQKEPVYIPIDVDVEHMSVGAGGPENPNSERLTYGNENNNESTANAGKSNVNNKMK